MPGHQDGWGRHLVAEAQEQSGDPRTWPCRGLPVAARRALLGAMVLLLSGCAGPANREVVSTRRPALGAQAPTVLAAVLAAARAWHASSVLEDREYVGAVIAASRTGTFHYTVGAGQPGADAVRFRVGLRRGERLVAFWHSHGAPGLARDHFSADDVELVRQTGVPLYLVTPGGALKVLVPEQVAASGRRRASLIAATGLPAGAARGELVVQLVARDPQQGGAIRSRQRLE